ncbi:hypothetical protein AKJ16_DCAP24465 [Drosera capensis]
MRFIPGLHISQRLKHLMDRDRPHLHQGEEEEEEGLGYLDLVQWVQELGQGLHKQQHQHQHLHGHIKMVMQIHKD